MTTTTTELAEDLREALSIATERLTKYTADVLAYGYARRLMDDGTHTPAEKAAQTRRVNRARRMAAAIEEDVHTLRAELAADARTVEGPAAQTAAATAAELVAELIQSPEKLDGEEERDMSRVVEEWMRDDTLTTVEMVGELVVAIHQDVATSEMLHDQRVLLTRADWETIGRSMGWTA